MRACTLLNRLTTGGTSQKHADNHRQEDGEKKEMNKKLSERITHSNTSFP